MSDPLQNTTLESLEVGATPVVRHFLNRLQLSVLFDRHLPSLPGRQPVFPSSTLLGVLLSNLLLARQPLYALPAWAARRVPEHLGLTSAQVSLLNDDLIGRALDHLYRADRACLLTDLVMGVVRAFEIDMSEFHQDTTTVTFSGDYDGQSDAAQTDRPPSITFGYNKDHRPDLKQLLYGITISSDGAVPVHAKVYDGNTSDTAVHIETWDFLCQIIGHADFLYVSDSKLCSRENMAHIAGSKGRFLTVMPRTRSEDAAFRASMPDAIVNWQEVHREANPRRSSGPDVVYQGYEGPEGSSEGYRILWYKSSHKQQIDAASRASKLKEARTRLAILNESTRGEFATPGDALETGQRILREQQVEGLLRLSTTGRVEVQHRQVGKGRPGPNTEYRRVEIHTYKIAFEDDEEGLRRAAASDGLFPLMTNDKDLTLVSALQKYKYQPFVEKRHEQLKNVFKVAPMWLKSPTRVASLLWLYHVVELVGALLEREVRRRMEQEELGSLALYPEGRRSGAPTAQLVINALEGHRRHRLLDEEGTELRRFHDLLGEPAQDVLDLLDIDRQPYGIL